MLIPTIEVEISADVRPAVRALRQVQLKATEWIGGAEAVAQLLREWAEQEGMTFAQPRPTFHKLTRLVYVLTRSQAVCMGAYALLSG